MVYYECGCRTYMSDHPNLFVPMVEYCPMHKAAPEVVNALRDLVETPAWNTRKLDLAWEQAYTALALVPKED